MAKIETLIDDIQDVLRKGKKLPSSALSKFGLNVALKLDRQLRRHERPARDPLTLRASEIGMVDSCARKLWYAFHMPEKGEAIDATAVMKFYYGDVVEETVLTLAKAAGHKVEREQEEIKFNLGMYKVVGHIDAVIDDVLVDVKSTTSYGLRDFEEGKGGDKFGYRGQLNVYAVGTGIKNKGWVAVDKTTGKMGYFPETKKYDTNDLFDKAVNALSKPDDSHNPHLPVVPDGKSGNLKLDVECSYCPYKKHCWRHANAGKGLRGFKYSTGITWLAHVVNEPKVPEVK